MSRHIAAATAVLLLAGALSACDTKSWKAGERPAVKDGDRNGDRDYGANREEPRDNARDRVTDAAPAVTPLTQGNNPADLETTQVIRRALMQAEGVSMAAKNITIITHDQVVTLKGSVDTEADRDAVVAAAQAAAGKNRVDDQIVVGTGDTARAD